MLVFGVAPSASLEASDAVSLGGTWGQPALQMVIWHETNKDCEGPPTPIAWYAYFQQTGKWRHDEYLPDAKTLGASHRFNGSTLWDSDVEFHDSTSMETDLVQPGMEVLKAAFNEYFRVSVMSWDPLGEDIALDRPTVRFEKVSRSSSFHPACLLAEGGGTEADLVERFWLDKATGVPLLYERIMRKSGVVIERQDVRKFDETREKDTAFYSGE